MVQFIFKKDRVGLLYSWVFVEAETRFFTFSAQNEMTKKYNAFPYFWKGLDSQIPNYVKQNSFITQMVATSIVSFYYHFNLFYSSSSVLTYKLTPIVLNGGKCLLYSIHTPPNIPCIKRMTILCNSYWLKILDAKKHLKKNHL